MTALLQMCPLVPLLEEGLSERFRVHRWFEIVDGDAWLAEHGSTVLGVVTTGGLGVENSLVARLPALRIIAISGVGFDKVDLQLARSRNIRVTYTPDVLTEDVADLALGLLICLLRGLPAADRHLKAGLWPTEQLPLGRKVSGRRFGIIGLGRIGGAIAERLALFGEVAYTGPSHKSSRFRYVADPIQLARESDVLVLAASAHHASRPIVGRGVLDALGEEGYLINVARGSLVDQDELIAALLERRIAGAALDVYRDEPNVPAALRALTNVVLTPHIGSATRETRVGMARMVLASLDAFRAGARDPYALT